MPSGWQMNIMSLGLCDRPSPRARQMQKTRWTGVPSYPGLPWLALWQTTIAQPAWEPRWLVGKLSSHMPCQRMAPSCSPGPLGWNDPDEPAKPFDPQPHADSHALMLLNACARHRRARPNELQDVSTPKAMPAQQEAHLKPTCRMPMARASMLRRCSAPSCCWTRQPGWPTRGWPPHAAGSPSSRARAPSRDPGR